MTMRAIWPTITLLFALVSVVLLLTPAPWWVVLAFSIPATVGGLAFLCYVRRVTS